jgi:hypothetical protein
MDNLKHLAIRKTKMRNFIQVQLFQLVHKLKLGHMNGLQIAFVLLCVKLKSINGMINRYVNECLCLFK